MLLDAVHVVGLAGAEAWSADGLDAVVDLPTPPAGVAVADGLSLLHLGLSPEVAGSVLAGLEIAGTDPLVHPDAHGFVEQVTGLDPAGVGALLHDETDRKVICSVGIRLDPQLYGRLREEAIRDPRVVTALGQDPTLGVKVGWLFTPDLSAASVTVLEVRVGELSFPIHAAERPAWLTPMLRDVGRRLARPDLDSPVEALGRRLLGASLSSRPSERAAFRRLAAAMAEPPFALGVLELVDSVRPVVAFGQQLRRARQFGPAALRSIRLAAVALLDAPDVLIVDEPMSDPARAWLVGCTTGPNATLEQILFVGSRA